MTPFPAVARGALNPGGDSDMRAAAGDFFRNHETHETMLIRHLLLSLGVYAAAFVVAWLITWSLCELRHGKSFEPRMTRMDGMKNFLTTEQRNTRK